MKRIITLMIGVIASVVLSSPASALPLFARQTGMACSACHFQHFPMLNSFGRSFKASGFTLMGAQGKVEDTNLSIPETLNMAVLTTAGYVKTNQTSAATAGSGVRDAGAGNIYVPGTNGETSLFVGGRVSEHAGFLTELSFLGSPGLASAKLPILYAVGDDYHAGVVLFTTDGAGASYGYETMNTGANAVHTMLFVGGDANGSIAPALSAQQYIGTATAATGAAIVANSSMGFVNVTKFHLVGPGDLGLTGAALTSTYIRAAGYFDLAGFDAGAGIQLWGGQSTDATLVQAETKASAIDFQMQGAVGAMPLGIYVTYASAPKTSTSAAGANVYNGGTQTKSALNVAAEIGVIPEVATVGAGLRMGKSGLTVGSNTNATDNAILVEGSYKLAQNMMLNLYYTKQSGGYWTTAQQKATGSSQLTINLATIF